MCARVQQTGAAPAFPAPSFTSSPSCTHSPTTHPHILQSTNEPLHTHHTHPHPQMNPYTHTPQTLNTLTQGHTPAPHTPPIPSHLSIKVLGHSPRPGVLHVAVHEPHHLRAVRQSHLARAVRKRHLPPPRRERPLRLAVCVSDFFDDGIPPSVHSAAIAYAARVHSAAITLDTTRWEPAAATAGVDDGGAAAAANVTAGSPCSTVPSLRLT